MTGPGWMRPECAECRTWDGPCTSHRRRTLREVLAQARRRAAWFWLADRR